MKLSLILEAIDRWSRPVGKAREETKKLVDQGIKPLEKSTGGLTGKIVRWSSSVGKARGEMKKLVDQGIKPLEKSTGGLTGKIVRWLNHNDRAIVGARKLHFAIRRSLISDFRTLDAAASGAARGLGRLALGATVLGIRLGGRALVAGIKALSWSVGGLLAGAAAGAGYFTRGMLGAAISIQNFEVELARVERSSARARTGLSNVVKYAKGSATPLADLTLAFVEARKAGIDMTFASFRAIEDTAVASKKSVSDIVAIMKDVRLGDYGGLGALDITAQKRKGQVVFTYLNREGKRVTRSVADNARAVEKVLAKVFSDRNGGASADRARTVEGMWQRIKNQMSGFMLSVAGKGIFARVETSLQNVLNWIEKVEKDGRLDRWAKRASNEMTKLYDAAEKIITKTNWGQVVEDVSKLANAIGGLAKHIEWLNRASAAAKWLNPASRGMDALGKLGEWYNQPPAPTTPAPPRAGVGPMGRPLLPQGRSARPPAPAVTGKISLHVTTDRGVSVAPVKVAARGVDLDVLTGGRAMRAIA